MILGGVLDLSQPLQPDADVFILDMEDTPKDVITRMHAMGKSVFCYFSAGSSEDWRKDLGSLSSNARGAGLKGWQGEVRYFVTAPVRH
jgi:hypothetical protein